MNGDKTDGYTNNVWFVNICEDKFNGLEMFIRPDTHNSTEWGGLSVTGRWNKIPNEHVLLLNNL